MDTLAVIGNVFLWILLVILVLIFLLFLFSLPKIRVILKYDGKLSVKLKFLIFKFNPSKKMNEKKSDNKNKSGPQKEKEERQKRRTEKKRKKEEKKKKFLPDFMKNLSIENYIEIIKIIFKQFIFKIKVENFFLEAKIAGENAAEAALKYGKITASLYPITAFLDAKGFIKQAKINVDVNFLSEESEYRGETEITIRLISLIKAAISIFIYIMKRNRQNK